MSPSGKATDSDSVTRGFESLHPNQKLKEERSHCGLSFFMPFSKMMGNVSLLVRKCIVCGRALGYNRMEPKEAGRCTKWLPKSTQPVSPAGSIQFQVPLYSHCFDRAAQHLAQSGIFLGFNITATKPKHNCNKTMVSYIQRKRRGRLEHTGGNGYEKACRHQ